MAFVTAHNYVHGHSPTRITAHHEVTTLFQPIIRSLNITWSSWIHPQLTTHRLVKAHGMVPGRPDNGPWPGPFTGHKLLMGSDGANRRDLKIGREQRP